MRNLTTKEVEKLKKVIALKENRLECDIKDKEVYEFIEDMETVEIQGSVYATKKDAHVEDYLWREPATRTDIVNRLLSDDDIEIYLPYI